MRRECCRRSALEELARLLRGWERDSRPPADLLVDSGACVHLSRAFLELSRLQGPVEGMARDACLPLDRPAATAALYLLTGHLRPANRPLLLRFLASDRFPWVAAAVSALDRIPPVRRYYVKHLFETNLFSKEMVVEWCREDETYAEYNRKLLGKAKKELGVEGDRVGTRLSSVPPCRMKSIYRSSRMCNLSTRADEYKTRQTKSILDANDVLVKPSKPNSDKMLNLQKPSTEVNTDSNFPHRKIDFISRNILNVTTKQEDKNENKSDISSIQDFNNEEFEFHENLTKNSKIRVDTRMYSGQKSLFKARTDFKNDELIHLESRKAIHSFRTNSATLLKEAAVILKEEEEDNRKLLGLLVGSSNFREYERLMEERLEEEREVFRLKVERLHLEGKLTDQAAVLARQRLMWESRERRKQFERERELLIEDMEKLREFEKENISALVGKVKEIRDRVGANRRAMEAEKRAAAERLAREAQEALREAVRERKEELAARVAAIREVRMLDALGRTLRGRVRAALGRTLVEMSLEELAAKKRDSAAALERERARRREEILAGIRGREELLDKAERFIWERREARRGQRSSSLRGPGFREVLPETFLRPVPKVYDRERLYTAQAKKELELVEEKMKRVLEERNECEQKLKKDLDIYDKALRSRKTPVGRRSPESCRPAWVSMVGDEEREARQTTGRTVEMRGSRRRLSCLTNLEVAWRRFGYFILNHTSLKLPKRFADLTAPPPHWVRELNVQRDKSKKQRSRKSKKKKTLTAKRIVQFRRKKPNARKKTEMLWMKRWKKFYKSLKENESCDVSLETLAKLQKSYTKSIVDKVLYFHNLFIEQNDEPETRKVAKSVQQCRDEITNLKLRLEILIGKVNKSKKRQVDSLRKVFRNGKRAQATKPPRRRLLFPQGLVPQSDAREYRAEVVKVAVLEKEDRAIREYRLPARVETGAWGTEPWGTEGEVEKEMEVEPSVRSLVEERRRDERPPPPPPRPSLEAATPPPEAEEYHTLKNRFGKTVYLLRPKMSRPLVWSWHPLVLNPPRGSDKRRRMKEATETAFEDYLKKNVKTDKDALLVRLMTSRANRCCSILASMKPAARERYLRQGPVQMILEYLRTHPQGGNPYRPPS